MALGLTVDATEKQIRAAYRMQSLKYHPDRAGASCTAAFQRVATAYAVLSDADKRAVFDSGGDVKASKKGGGDDDSEEEAEEHKQSLREEIERKYYPEVSCRTRERAPEACRADPPPDAPLPSALRLPALRRSFRAQAKASGSEAEGGRQARVGR